MMITTLWNIYKAFILKLIQLFFPWNRRNGGKLHVSGKGSLVFNFQTYPQDAHVRFVDEPVIVPCNPCDPGKTDQLYWKVRREDNGFSLTIYWDVVGIRTIQWSVCD